MSADGRADGGAIQIGLGIGQLRLGSLQISGGSAFSGQHQIKILLANDVFLCHRLVALEFGIGHGPIGLGFGQLRLCDDDAVGIGRIIHAEERLAGLHRAALLKQAFEHNTASACAHIGAARGFQAPR